VRRLLWLILLLTIPGTAQAGYEDWYSRQTSGVFGLKAGFISSGNLKVGQAYHTEIGSTGQAFFDLPLRPNLFAVAAFDFYNFRLDAYSQWMLDINLGLKPSFYMKKLDADIKPAISIGWGHLEMFNSLETSDFLTLRMSCESHFYVNKKRAWVIETAILYAPTAGNDQYPKATFGPMLLLRAGVAMR
jgi:hypothetical protein